MEILVVAKHAAIPSCIAFSPCQQWTYPLIHLPGSGPLSSPAWRAPVTIIMSRVVEGGKCYELGRFRPRHGGCRADRRGLHRPSSGPFFFSPGCPSPELQTSINRPPYLHIPRGGVFALRFCCTLLAWASIWNTRHRCSSESTTPAINN